MRKNDRTRTWRKMLINPLPKKKEADFDYEDETAAIERAILLNGPGREMRTREEG